MLRTLSCKTINMVILVLACIQIMQNSSSLTARVILYLSHTMKISAFVVRSLKSFCVELVKLILMHRYSVDIFSYSVPSGILGSDRKQNTT